RLLADRSNFIVSNPAIREIYTLSLHDALPIFNSRFKSLDTLKVKIISVTFRRVIRTNHKKASKIWRHENIQLGGCQSSVQQECRDRKSGSAGMPRPISYAVFCLKKKRDAAQPS